MKTDKSELLSDRQVKRIAGSDSKVILYPDLSKFNNIDELFGDNFNKIIILYLNNVSDKSVIGHWTLLTRVIRDGKTIYEFADSYGKSIDDPLDWHSDSKNDQLGQGYAYLSRLLKDELDQNDKDTELHFNESQVQSRKNNINTCGRWVALRARYYQIPLEQWQSIFKEIKREGYDLDEFVTIVTNHLLGRV